MIEFYNERIERSATNPTAEVTSRKNLSLSQNHPFFVDQITMRRFEDHNVTRSLQQSQNQDKGSCVSPKAGGNTFSFHSMSKAVESDRNKSTT